MAKKYIVEDTVRTRLFHKYGKLPCFSKQGLFPLPCLVMSCVLPCLALSCLVVVLSCLVVVLSCPVVVLSCLVLFCLVLSCLVTCGLASSRTVVSCLVLSCLVSSCISYRLVLSYLGFVLSVFGVLSLPLSWSNCVGSFLSLSLPTLALSMSFLLFCRIRA
jgi:hypothetical protein